MALQSYMRDLVRQTSNVEIVFDNSTSEIPHHDLLSLSNPQEDNMSLNSSTTTTSSSCCCPSTPQEQDQQQQQQQQQHHQQCYRNAGRNPSRPLEKVDSARLLEDLRERRRQIRSSMSPLPFIRQPTSSNNNNTMQIETRLAFGDTKHRTNNNSNDKHNDM